MKKLQPLLAAFVVAFADPVFAVDKLEPGLMGEYFDLGSSLEDFPVTPADQKPVVKRVDRTIDFESTLEGFHGTALVDFFFIRWTGRIRIPRDGNYTFILESDDGSRLFVDGKQIIDHNGLHAMEEMSGEIELKSGDHDIKIEFFENDVDAGCRFLWRPPGAPKEIVPAAALFHQVPAPPPQAGLRGEYFDLRETLDDFPTISPDKKPVITRVDETINFESTQEAFPGTQLVDSFYIRWTGTLRVPKDGVYTFFLESDDGSRLFINDERIVSNGGRHHMTEKSGEAELSAGLHSIKIEFFENDSDAGCIFSWQPPAGKKEVVSSTALSTGN